MQRYKDCDPKDTVRRIKDILADVGIHPEGELESYADRFFSMRLEDPALGIATNGKGASPELAWASGYGEFMERLQNDFLIDTKRKTTSKDADADGSSASHDFLSWPDERVVTFDEALQECPVVIHDLERNYVAGDDVRSAWTDAVDPQAALAFWRGRMGDAISLVPYYCVGTDSLVEMPDTILRMMSQSNGLASGNTPEEALVEGMSEICERYAKARILNDELCPPPIPRSFIEEYCPEQAEMLRIIEEHTPELNIVILDASLGQGIPTVCMLFIDQRKGSIRPKFGSHPTIAVALERCMTEQYQGCAREEQLSLLFTPWDAWSRKTVHSFALSCAAYGSDQFMVPDRMLVGTPDWTFDPWGIDASYTNRQGARQLAQLLRKLGGEVYIRANGYLGVSAFRIYVPCVTGLFSPGGDVPYLTKKFGMQRTCALAAYKRGDYALAAEFLKKNNDRLDFCAAQELLCRAEGVPEEQRDVLLETYFGAGAAAYAKSVWRSDDAQAALRSFIRREAFFTSLGTAKVVDNRKLAREELIDKLRQRKAANPIDQMGIHEIFG